MKNITSNQDGTINLNGLTREEAFTLYLLAANAVGKMTGDIYDSLKKLFPEYHSNQIVKFRNPPSAFTFCSQNDCEIITTLARKYFKKDKNVVKNSTPALERDAMGRFISKNKNKLLVRFWYPCSKTNRPVHRIVEIDQNENPDSYLYFSSILGHKSVVAIQAHLLENKSVFGFDQTRKDIRNFNMLRIKRNNMHVVISKA